MDRTNFQGYLTEAMYQHSRSANSSESEEEPLPTEIQDQNARNKSNFVSFVDKEGNIIEDDESSISGSSKRRHFLKGHKISFSNFSTGLPNYLERKLSFQGRRRNSESVLKRSVSSRDFGVKEQNHFSSVQSCENVQIESSANPGGLEFNAFPGLKRTLTVGSVVANWNRSFRQRVYSRTQSFKNMDRSRIFQFRPSAPTTRMSTSDLRSHKEQLQSGRFRARGLSNIDPKFVSQSGLCSSSELETSRGAIRIQHLTAGQTSSCQASSSKEGVARFPRLQDCAHFHYESTEIGPLSLELVDKDEELRSVNPNPEPGDSWLLSVQVTSKGRTWVVRRSYENFVLLDKQSHQCIYDRRYSQLPEIVEAENLPISNGHSHEDSVRQLLSGYLCRFSSLAGPVITCGPVLNWFELDNRGHRLIVTDDGAINTPAVAAAYVVKRYTKQAPDEISFEVGDMISVIDMPPPDESIWWRGKRGFEVGFFPGECVEVIGDKVPHGLSIPLNSNGDSGGDSGLDNDSADSPSSSGGSSSDHHHPTKPVLRKHGKLISFFRSFILSRPSRGKLKKSGILKERVFGCDLSEHLLNTGQEVPRVLTHCAEFIEEKGIIDGIYRLSGIASNIQKLRVAFDEDRVPNLHDDRGVLQDIHSVSSLVKMYFRELPNPICTYHLYEKFVEAAKAKENQRLVLLRDVVQQLPPPNYRTLEYLSRHLYRVSLRGGDTGMTAKNVAIVWAPNLLRSKSLEVGGVAALQGVGVQAVVTEYLIRYCELIFSDKMPVYQSITSSPTPKKQLRPKSLAISTPTKLLSLEEARNRALSSAGNGAATTACGIPLVQQESQRYIEVGGGPEKLPPKYHTVIDLSSRKGSGGGSLKHHRRSPIAWKNIFSGKNKGGKPGVQRKLDLNDIKSDINSTLNGAGNRQIQTLLSQHHHQKLRPVRSAESLIQPAPSSLEGIKVDPRLVHEINPASYTSRKTESSAKQRQEDSSVHTKVNPNTMLPNSPNESRPISMDLDELAPLELVQRAMGQSSIKNSPKTHSRSSSHDSYFERKLSVQFNSGDEGGELLSPAEGEPSRLESNLDLSEIQMNFELEDNEMRIFSEDEATMMSNSIGSDMNKSPLDENKPFGGSSALKRAPKILEGSDEGSPKARKMSFREKFKRFTSPTPNRKETSGSVSISVKEPESRCHHTSLKDKIVGALSPESLRKKPTGSEIPMMDESPQIPFPQCALVSTSTTTTASTTTTTTTATTASSSATTEDDVVASSNGLPLSPSINFIDASMHESLEKKDKNDSGDINSAGGNTPDEFEEEFDDDQRTVISASSVEKKLLRQDLSHNHHHQQQRLSVASRSTNEDLTSISSSNSQAQTDKLVIAAQIHHVPIIEEGLNNVRQEQFPIIETSHEETQPIFEPESRVNELSEIEDDIKRKHGSDLRVSPSLSSSYHPESGDESVLISSPSLRNPHLQTVQASIDTLQSLVQDEGSLGCVSPIPTSLHHDSNNHPTSWTDQDSDNESAAIIIEETITETFDTAPTNLSFKAKDPSDDDKEGGEHDGLVLISTLKGEYLKRDIDTHMDVDQPEKMDYDESVVSAMAVPIEKIEQPVTSKTLEMSAPIVYQAKTSTHIVRHVALPDTKMSISSPTTPSSPSSKGFSPSPTLSPGHHRLALVGPTPYQRRSSVSSVSSCEEKPAFTTSPSPPIPKPRNISKPPTPKFDIIANDIPLDDEPKLSFGEEDDIKEEKAFSLPFGIDDMDTAPLINTLSSSTPPTKVKEKRLQFSEPTKRLTVSKSVDRIEFKTRLSTTSLHTQIEEENPLVNEEPPLQRRNSIHNVPFVDVSDPQTRERMERYKEERRSMLRAKYKVEDYKTKKVSVEEVEPPKPKARRSVPSSPTVEVPLVVPPHPLVKEENRPVEHVEMRKKKGPMMEPPKPRERSFNGTKKSANEEEVNVKERAAIFGVSKTRENKLRTVSLGTSGIKNNNRRTSIEKSPPGAPSKIKNMAAMFEQK